MLPEDRWRATANPDLQNANYGSVEAFLSIHEGELNTVEPMLLPLLNPEVPFVLLEGGGPRGTGRGPSIPSTIDNRPVRRKKQ